MKLIVIGGAKSGKSQYCVKLLKEKYKSPCLVVTAEPKDPEMEERIKRHKENRPKEWLVTEEPVEIALCLKDIPKDRDVVLIDCLTLWLSNMLLSFDDEKLLKYVEDFVATVRDYPSDIILVSNEVGLGIVPDNPLARKFRDLSGMLNQRLVDECDSAIFMIAGTPIRIK